MPTPTRRSPSSVRSLNTRARRTLPAAPSPNFCGRAAPREPAHEPHRRKDQRPGGAARRPRGRGSADVVRPWVDALRNVGFAVFAKPKLDEDSDVDSDMLAHIAQRSQEGLAALMVASADGQAFRLPLEEISRSGVPVQVLGFREHASWALASDTLEFVDLEDIVGVFREPLPRIGLDSLPEKGAWLQPFRPLSSLLTSRV